MGTTPIFISTPRNGACRILGTASSANTGRDGSGTLNTNLFNVIAAGSSGTRIDDLRIKATTTTTAGQVRLFVYDSVATTSQFLDEIAVSAIVPSATVQSFSGQPNVLPIFLEAGRILRATSHNANETFDITVAQGGDF